MEDNEKSLTTAVRRTRQRTAGPTPGTTGGEPSPYEQVTRRGLDDLTRQVERIETKLNGILITVVGSILIDLYRSIIR